MFSEIRNKTEISEKEKQICVSCVICHLSPVTCHLSPVTCHMSPVTCQVSYFMCHLSHVTCHMSPVICQYKNSHSNRPSPCNTFTMHCSWTKNTKRLNFFEKQKKSSKTQKLNNLYRYAKISDTFFPQLYGCSRQ